MTRSRRWPGTRDISAEAIADNGWSAFSRSIFQQCYRKEGEEIIQALIRWCCALYTFTCLWVYTSRVRVQFQLLYLIWLGGSKQPRYAVSLYWTNVSHLLQPSLALLFEFHFLLLVILNSILPSIVKSGPVDSAC